jgi:hypothetical protein
MVQPSLARPLHADSNAAEKIGRALTVLRMLA